MTSTTCPWDPKWDERFNGEEYAYGEDPNEYLKQTIEQLNHPNPSAMKVLTIGEGEGRNAIYLAKLGYQVVAVDGSQVGLKKLSTKAETLGLNHKISIHVADLNEYDLSQHSTDGWDIVVSIFAHTDSKLRKKLHQQIEQNLKADGVFILLGYHIDNIGRGTGGPPTEDLCLTSEKLLQDFQNLEILRAEEKEYFIEEGKYHKGISKVVEFLGKKK